MGIVLYRYFLVLKSSFVQTGARRRILSRMIFIWIMATSVIMTCWAIYYEDYNYQDLGDKQKFKIKYKKLSQLCKVQFALEEHTSSSTIQVTFYNQQNQEACHGTSL